MTPAAFLSTVLAPSVAWCKAVPGWRPAFDDRAMLLLLAIGGQEGEWDYRVQGGGGPAHGFWQFERGGGVHGVIVNPSTAAMAKAAMTKSGLCPLLTEQEAYAALALPQGDGLATAFARLLLWSDAAALPAVGDEQPAWAYYQRNWRPGKPGPDRWPGNYGGARTALGL